MILRAIIAAAGGFAVGFAYRDRIQRQHEREKIKKVVGGHIDGITELPSEFGEFE